MTTLYIVLAVALVVLIALTILYFVQQKKKARAAGDTDEPAGPGGDEVSLLIGEANSKLSAAKAEPNARVGNLPVYIVMGEPGCAKTSVMVNSGLDPELLAGQVYQNNTVVSTRSANLWFSRRAIFVEAGGKLPSESSKWARLVQKLAPRTSVVGKGEQAPRAAVVCFDCENFTKPGVQELVTAAARNWRARLGEISESMGINLPVYVLFTKMDRLPFFTEYVRNLSNDEGTQVLGATLPMLTRRNEGVYAEEESARLAGHFEVLFRSLADGRAQFLSRENEAAKLPPAYEFPREFRKIRPAAVQFLVDLCRPSQLTTGPFLRGFYFTGVRPIVINESAPVAAAPLQQGGYGSASGATGIFRAGAQPQAQPMAAPVASTRKVPQWMFLSHFFNDILLADRAAMGASGASTKTSSARRLLFIAASLLCLILIVAFTISFFQNHGLESRVRDAARGIPSGESTGADLASAASLGKLDTLRQSLETLVAWRHDGAPWSYRWGLYAGNDLYPEARRVYFDRFRQLLFGQTQGGILQFLRTLPATPGPDYGTTYSALKGYLITTSYHDKSTKLFLSPVLMQWWTSGRTVDPERQQLAQRQFDFYANELKEENPYSKENDSLAIEKARRYLAQFAGAERVYAFMIAEAGKNNPPINFNRQFPGSAQTVVETHEVAGAFSKGGWGFMKDAIAHADRYFSGEQWVLGDQAGANIDRAKLEQDLKSRYYGDFVKEWRAYIKSASVVRYAGLKDASQKLTQLSGNQSPLLELMALASQNTAVDDPNVAAIFQPVQAVVPPTSTDRFIAPPNQNYMNALVTLQTSIDQIANQPGTPSDAAAAQTLSNAQQATVNTRQMAQTFRIDQEGHIEGNVQKLLEDPITYAQGLLRTLGPAELNGKGRDLCGQMRPVLAKYPFSANATAQATASDVTTVFQPKTGLLWQFVDANLQKALTRQGSQFVPNTSAGINVNPAFLGFLNRAAAFSDAAFQGGSPDPHFNYSVKPVVSPDTDNIKLTIDGQSADFKGNSGAKTFVWPGAAHEAKLSVKFKGGTEFPFPSYDGLWAIFQMVGDADKHTGALVEMTLRSGRQGRPILNPSGQPVTVRFEIAATPPIFDRGYFSGLSCVAEVAKP
jgi:type VI secretion system protein ImpL